MKNKLLVTLLISLAIVSISNAQYSQIIRQRVPNQAKAKAEAAQLIAIANATNADTIFITDASTPGIIEATINGDTTTNVGRTNINRVYKLSKSQIYTQNAGLSVYNPHGTLIIVGEPGGTKPVITLTGVNGVDPGMNTVVGSIKLDNIHMQNEFTNDNGFNNNCFVGSTDLGLPQSVDVNNCLFEFIQLDTFSCDGYTNGAKFRFTNSYFRNLFNVNQWWGGRVFYCKRPIDTVWVENCTVTGGGLIFLQQSSMCKFAYYNHNTIINSNKYWQLGVYYLEGYWVNNLFINQNWVGEDFQNVATGGQDPDPGMLMGNFGMDTLWVQGGKLHAPINIQPSYLNPDSTINQSLCGLDKMQALVANNILWTDTVMLKAYYHNMQIGGFGPYGTAFGGVTASSYLTWSIPQADTPSMVVNIPSIWMNPRTTTLFATYHKLAQADNHINVQVSTVTPAIADAATADQMARWNAQQWGVPGFSSSTQDILHSKYIWGDYDPTTIPGIKTEDGSGITKFTDLNESFAQSGTVINSTIDQLPIGALIWDDAKLAAYDSKAEWAKVWAFYLATGVAENKTSAVPQHYGLSQNYPNPFNPTTQISFSVPSNNNGQLVTLKVYNVLGQEVQTLFSGTKSAGSYTVPFDGSKLASGVYLYRLQAGNTSITKKMVMMK